MTDEDKKSSDKNEEKKDDSSTTQTTTDKDKNKFSSEYLMKKGDYSVHILLEEIRNCEQKDDKVLGFPMVKLTCFGKTQRSTKPKLPCESYIIDEHFYFDKNDLTIEQLDSSKIVVEAYDGKNSKHKKDYYGIYEYDLQYIYAQKDHALQNVWLALANPESDDITKVRGFLKLSIGVFHESDQKIEIISRQNDSECMLPSQIKMEYKLISLYILKAEQLPEMDYVIKQAKSNKQCNAFIEVKYLGITKKTSVVDQVNDQVTWNEIIDIPVSIPIVSQKIVLNVKDWDIGNTSDEIGSIEINVNDIVEKNIYDEFCYFNIYGSPQKLNKKYMHLMNTNSEIGSRWNGRLLMMIKCSDCDSPSPAKRKITDQQILRDSENINRSNFWNLYIKIYDGTFLPSKSDEYGFRVSFEEKNENFDKKKAINGYVQVNKYKNLQIKSLSNHPDDLPDVFIYLVNKKDEAICFQRIKAREFFLNEELMIIKLAPDPCYEKVKFTWQSGIVKIKATLMNTTSEDSEQRAAANRIRETYKNGCSDGEEEEDDLEKMRSASLLDNQLPEICLIVCVVHMTRYVISGDSDGKNDPFVEVICVDDSRSTDVKQNTINGIWNQPLYFDTVVMNIKNKSTWPILMVKLADQDIISKDLLGYSYVWLRTSQCQINSDQLAKPKWHQLFLPKSNKQQGEILLSFYVFDMEHKNLAQNIVTKPETIPYTVNINILGLRELKPLSLISIKKPFIKFDLNSLNVTGNEEDFLQPISTPPKDCGPNPTINSVLSFNVRLPKDTTFIPELQCEVFDHLLSGMLNPSLGVFLIDVKKIIRDTEKNIDRDIENANEKLSLLAMKGLVSKQLGGIMGLKEKSRDRIFSNIGKGHKMKGKRKGKGKGKGKGKKQFDLLEKVKGMKKIQMEKEDKKDEDSENKKDESKKDLIDTSNKSEDLIDTSSKKKEEEEEDEEKKQNKLSESKLDENTQFSALKTVVENKIIKRENFDKYKNNPSYFVLLPQFKTYKVPGVKNDSVNAKKEYRIEDLNQAPNPKKYFPLGYINKQEKELDSEGKLTDIDLSNPSKITKHYRRIYNKNLETITKPNLNMTSPFLNYYLKREADKDDNDETNIFEAITESKNKIIKKFLKEEISIEDEEKTKKLKEDKNKFKQGLFNKRRFGRRRNKRNQDAERNQGYGLFKGLITICEKTKFEEYEKLISNYTADNREGIEKLRHLNKYRNLTKRILIKNPVVIRLYVLELTNLEDKDNGSASDPYIKIYLGGKLKFNEQDHYILNSKNAQWYKYYDINNEFPGDSSLRIDVYDYDPLFADDLIGSTTIDLEDRYFNENWRNLQYKPIEVRKLFHPDIEKSQGEISLWVEIFEKKDKINMEPWNIKPEPPSTVEMRLIIWETEEMKMMDVEGTSDVFITAFLEQKNKQSTDIHFRCQTGVASFNWRIVLPIHLPNGVQTLTLQAYDNDIFTSNDYICGAEINLSSIINIVKELDIPVTLNSNYYNDVSEEEKKKYSNIQFLPKSEDDTETKFWVQCFKNNQKEGRILCSLEILPMWKAELTKVGLGRSDPNVAPYLPPPFGRISFTLNPFKMINQCVGPKFRRKIYCGCAMCCLGIYLCCVIPYIILYLSGEIVNPFNW